jgi:ketosteroid isomerase-like protein
VSNVETMQQVYEAFGRGDVPAILERLAEDVRWEQSPVANTAQTADIPYMRARSGREAVAGFFSDLMGDVEMTVFEPHTFLEGDGCIAVLIRFELTVRSTGKRVQDEEIHFVEFGPTGEITSFRHFLDTAKAIEAHA